MSAPMNARGALDAEEDQTTPRASISPPRTARCFVEESPGASPPQKCIERVTEPLSSLTNKNVACQPGNGAVNFSLFCLVQEEVRSLSDFQKLVLLWVLCPERFATCSDWLVERMVGPMKLESQAMRLQVHCSGLSHLAGAGRAEDAEAGHFIAAGRPCRCPE